MSKAFCVDRFGEWQIARSLTHVRAAVGSRRRRGETRMCEIGSGGRRREGSHPAQKRRGERRGERWQRCFRSFFAQWNNGRIKVD